MRSVRGKASLLLIYPVFGCIFRLKITKIFEFDIIINGQYTKIIIMLKWKKLGNPFLITYQNLD
jgi:hypothetical protein